MSRNCSALKSPRGKRPVQQTNTIEIADHHLSNFELNRQRGNIGKSFAELSLALCVLPSLKDLYYSSYLEVFESWASLVEEKYGFKKSMTLFEVALKHYPDSNDLKHLLAKILYRHGSVYEAWSYACLAHSGCPEDPNAQETRDHLTNALIDRWHLPMLNDAHRNLSFKRAIEEAVKQGHNCVLDIGSGTSLLSIYAKWSGAKQVFGCEINKYMCEIAKGVLGSNECTTGVQTFNLHSSDLVITKHIPKRVSLVISETVDAGLFGEHILSTLQHAWAHLLLPPAPFDTVQEDATLKSDGTSNSHSLSSLNLENQPSYSTEKSTFSHRKSTETLKRVNERKGISESEMTKETAAVGSFIEHGRVIPLRAEIFIALISCRYIANYSKLLHSDLSFFQNRKVVLKLEEPYLSEKLNQVPGGFKLLSDWVPLTEVNFNCPADIDKHLNGSLNKTLEIKCSNEGTLDAIALAFNLHTNDKNCISTLPDVCSAAWENAIYPLNTIGTLNANDIINVDFDCHGVIKLALHCDSANVDQSLSEPLYLSADALMFLNSQSFISSFIKAAEIMTQHLRNNVKINSSESLVICDTSPFPIAGMLIVSQFPSAQLYVEEETVLMSLKDVGIQAKLSEELEEEIDILFLWPVTKEGTLKDGIMKKILMYRLMMADDGMVFPKELDLVMDAINSPVLCNMTKVSNTHTWGVRVDDIFNIAKTNHHVDVPLEALPHNSIMSQPAPMIRISLMSGDVIPFGKLCETVEGSLLILGGDISNVLAEGIAQKSSSIHALPYWFILRADLIIDQMKLNSSCSSIPSFSDTSSSLKSGSVALSTRDTDSPCNQSLLILDKYYNTVDKKPFGIKLTWRDGIFSAKIQDVKL